MIQRREYLAATAGGVAAALAGCAGGEDGGDAEILDETLTLTTTTSTFDTGLLDEVNAAFEDRFGAAVDAVAQGTGAALETGRNGDSDVVMVHARSLEDEFIREGFGVNRRDLMFNDFVVVGPEDDPAGIDGMAEVTAAFQAIAETGSTFISRGDNSGTHTKELGIWDAAGVEPGGEWYREAGSGMGEVLNQANQTPGYTLADRGTYLSQRSELEISIRLEGPIEGGPELLANPYGVVAVNPGVHENVNYDLALSYIGFLTSREGQEIIQNYTVEGEQLFFPEAVSENPNFQQYVPENWTPNDG
ncbi:MAG: substrate-binding domain-containing protein [Natronomonas sp.]